MSGCVRCYQHLYRNKLDNKLEIIILKLQRSNILINNKNMRITLKEQIDKINDEFDKQEAELKSMRKRLIEEAWQNAVATGTLKQDLE